MMTVLWLGSLQVGAAGPTATPNPSLTPTSPSTSASTQMAAAAQSTLNWGQTLTALLIMGFVLLAAGALVIWARQQAGTRVAGSSGAAETIGIGSAPFEAGASVVRSWIAISLVIGLLLFCALTFAVQDPTLRSTLIGGLTASVGSAIAFYFSTKSAEQARQDLVNTIVGSEVVPDLHGMSEATAASTLGKTSLKLEINPPGSKDPTAIVAAQNPARGVSALKGSSVHVQIALPLVADELLRRPGNI